MRGAEVQIMPDAGQASPRIEAKEDLSPLERALAEEHAYIRELARRAEQARPTDEEPRLQFRLTDTFSAVLCRHLAAVDDVLLPRARKELSHGHARVHDYVRHARRLEQTLHLLKARLYGDATALSWTWEEVWDGIDGWLEDHVSHEQALIHALSDHLTTAEAQGLAVKLPVAEERAPTRPHPYTPHTGALGRIAHRLWARADSFWDDAEGRIVPSRRRPRRRRTSLLSRYFTGISANEQPSANPGEQRRSTGT